MDEDFSFLLDLRWIYGKTFQIKRGHNSGSIVRLSLETFKDPTDVALSTYLSLCLNLKGTNEDCITILKTGEEIEKMIDTFLTHNQSFRINSGSMVEGTEILGSDYDILCILNCYVVDVLNDDNVGQGKIRLIADTSKSRCGFTRLIMDMPLLPKSNSNFFFSSKTFVEFSILGSSSSKNVKVSRDGPSNRIEQKLGRNKKDVIYSLRCNDWPPAVSHEWLARDRLHLWPPKKLVEKLRHTLCIVIPAGDPDSEFCSQEWRLAFPIAERDLMWSLNETQLRCFVMLKILNKNFLKTIFPDEVSSFHLKMVLFWECENSPSEFWIETNFIRCVWQCLDKLKIAIENRYLSHYIMKSRNVFCTKLKDAKINKKLICAIEDIKTNIGASIYKCIKNVHIEPSLLEAVVSSTFIEQFSNHFLEIVAKFISSLKYRKTVCLLNCLLNRMQHICMICPDKSKLLKLFENISISTSNHSNKMVTGCKGYVQINIGSRIAAEAERTTGSRKERIMCKADSYFANGVGIDNFSGKLYLATFLMHRGCISSAEKQIASVFSQDGILISIDFYTKLDSIRISGGEGELVYCMLQGFVHDGYALEIIFGPSDMVLVPDALKFELCMIEYRQEVVSIHALVYAYFLRFLIYFESKDSRTKACLNKLRTVIDLWMGALIEWPSKPTHFNLLAYCYRKLGLVKEAIYYYQLSMKVLPFTNNSALFQLCCLLNDMLQMRYDQGKTMSSD